MIFFALYTKFETVLKNFLPPILSCANKKQLGKTPGIITRNYL